MQTIQKWTTITIFVTVGCDSVQDRVPVRASAGRLSRCTIDLMAIKSDNSSTRINYDNFSKASAPLYGLRSPATRAAAVRRVKFDLCWFAACPRVRVADGGVSSRGAVLSWLGSVRLKAVEIDIE